ncbi:hypothetical protein J6590_041697 [Homalodisca vitripennis]|nr:hypothetical protein J6590_041697 [Homalodisca vitripennis]
MNEQDSSIYPHLYIANTIDFPQEYFTGGFLQQDPVSYLERPEEYVLQLSNMEKTTGYTDELEQSLISITGDYQQQPVWTDVETQASTSFRNYNHTETLFEEVTRGAEMNVLLAQKFGHGKQMARFMREHQEFFARALKASELFAWMCFGITTDEVFQGNGIMAASYALSSTDSKNPNIFWNYPLATMIRARPENVAEPPPLVIYDEGFSADLAEDFIVG